MGFMDKAKKLAGQAPLKLDDAQQSFNQSASPEQEPQAEETPAAPGEALPAFGPDVNQTPDPFKPLR
jgi:hypothetical protein